MQDPQGKSRGRVCRYPAPDKTFFFYNQPAMNTINTIPLAALVVAAATLPVAAQQLTPTPEEVIQDLLNKGVPMEQIEEMMEQAETRRGRSAKTRMESRLKDGAVSLDGAGFVCEGLTCKVPANKNFSLATPMPTPVTNRKPRICGTINGKLQYC
ncbi:hypothetical protein KR52_09055 [Synechococcus sp. KORDI-52]|nr:hypothetical protein KR52_09055 [Synechococcus sp. KORDI-52]